MGAPGTSTGWVKVGARAYRDGDKRLIKHTRTFHLEVSAPKLSLKSEVDWKLDPPRDPNIRPPNDQLKFNPGAPKSTRLIEATAALMGGQHIKLIEGEGRDWSALDLTLYRAAEALQPVALADPDIEAQPQVLWHDPGGDDPKRPPALVLVLTLPAESFDLLEEHLRSKAPGAITFSVSIDIFEDAETYSWRSAFSYFSLYIASGSSNAAMFETLRIAPPAGPKPSAPRDRLIEAAEEAIAAHIKDYCEEWKIEDKGDSQTERMLEALCRAAAEHDAANGISVEDFKRRTFRFAVSLVDGLRRSVTPYSEREKGKLNFWNYPRQHFFEIRRDQKATEMDRAELEDMTSRYLRMPYRCAEFDRMLTDMLASAEMYAYGETMLVKNSLASWLFGVASSPLYSHPIRTWFIGQVWNLVFFGILGALTWWAASAEWIGPDATFWIAVVIGGIWLLLLGISILALPFFIYRSAREKAATINRLNAMQAAYAAIGVSGPISARHVTQRFEAAANHDVIWPGALFVLLDDIVARGGRF